jgi:hypothetical protein
MEADPARKEKRRSQAGVRRKEAMDADPVRKEKRRVQSAVSSATYRQSAKGNQKQKDFYAKNKKKNKQRALLHSSDNVSGGTGLDATVQASKRKRPPLPRITQPDEIGPLIGNGEAGHAATTRMDCAPAPDHAPSGSAQIPVTTDADRMTKKKESMWYIHSAPQNYKARSSLGPDGKKTRRVTASARRSCPGEEEAAY